MQLGHAATERCDGPFGSGLTSEHYTDDGALVVRLQNIKAGSFHSGEPAYIGLDYFRRDLSRHAVQTDDLLIAGLGDERNVVGRACVAPAGLGEALVKADCFRFRLNPQLAIPQFTALQLSAGAAFDAGVLAGGTTRSRIPLGPMASRKLALPPLDEQAVITTFLDHETAKIDGLIAEQEKLIALLAEKRQATISHAVTRGLNPQAPMKDSGVPWLGEVPAHWEIKSIGHVLDAIADVDHLMPPSVDNGVPYLMTGDLRDFVSEVRFDDCKQVSQGDYLALSKRVKNSKGDVIMARYATIGTSMYVDIDADFLVSYSCVTLKTNGSKASGVFLFQYMKSDAFRQGIEHQINTNTQGNVGIKDLKNVKIAVPPLNEQAFIATLLASKTSEFNVLKAEAEHAVGLLKERRSALIAAAVTGQIDVRGFTAA